MKNHLTERELIEYQFKLASAVRMKETAEHLKGCGQCRELLEKLRRKFAALDLLRDDVKVSEDLIARVTEQAKEPVKREIVPFKKSTWVRAVAAVLIIGFFVLVADLSRQGEQKQKVAEKPLPATEEMRLESKKDSRSLDLAHDKLSVNEKESIKIAEGTKEARIAADTEEAEIVAGRAEAEALEKAILQPPPFAPASAIELVTLPRRDKVQLTIYNSADLTLVRERRNLTLKKGWNWLQFMWTDTLIDPTSLSLEPMAQADKIDIQQLVFPARLREISRWLIRSEISGRVPFEITYFTSGLSWRAFYMGTLSRGEKAMRLHGYIRVANNSGEDYENAQTRLIVGQVHLLDEIAGLARRRYPYGSPIGTLVDGRYHGLGGAIKEEEKLEGNGLVVNQLGDIKKELDELMRKEIVKEGLSEYFLYTIEGTETIADKWGKRLLSFDIDDIEVESLYKYDEERWGNQTIRFVKFANDEEHNLGQTPIPSGNVKIYSRADEQGHLSYVGGTNIKYIPVNEKVELNLGSARLVKVEPKLMDFKTENFVFDKEGDITGWDEIRTWEVEITNTRELPIEVEITRGFDTAYWTISTDIPREKYDATHVRFKLNLEPRSKKSFRYEVRTYHGEREEAMTQ